MNSRAVSIFITVGVFMCAASLQSFLSKATQQSPSVIGTWKLVSVETVRPNGEALTEWLGKRPTGTLVYLASGYMSVQMMRDPRPLFAGQRYGSATVPEKVAAIDGYYAYYGTYEVDLQSGTITHQVEASLRPTEVGISYQRRFELIGDRLTLTTPTFTEAGEARYNRLIWERAK